MNIRIGSRSSSLALKQVEISMEEIGIEDYVTEKIVTKGDKESAKGRTQFDKLNFVQDIEEKISSGDIDIAVHSAKDLPATESKEFDYFYLRESTEDISTWSSDRIIFRDKNKKKFSSEMILGTSSLRRKMQAKFLLGAKKIFSLNGNIDTRIKKLNSGEYDCIILANAGCTRLGFNLNSYNLDFLTPSAQGLICLQCLKGTDISKMLNNFFDKDKYKIHKLGMDIYKSFLRNINADCNSAISVRSVSNGRIANGEHKLTFQVFGKNEFFSAEKTHSDPQKLIELATEEFNRNNAKKLLDEHN